MVDNSVTSNSGLCPSPTEQEYRPKYFDEPDCLSSDKENMPPIESITPPSLKNLSLEEENIENDEHEATSWEANVARNLDLLPRSNTCQNHQYLLPSPREMKLWGFSQIKEEYPMDGLLVSEGSQPG